MAKYVKTEQGYKEPTEIVDIRFDSKMNKNNPFGTGSFSMGRKAGSVVGDKSHAEGNDTTASGSQSHAEGGYTTASGIASHAEGESTAASGKYSHAEGNSTNKFSSIVTATNPTNAAIIAAWKSNKFSLAKGTSSHVEGGDSLAFGMHSHAEGSATIASGNYSHSEGARTTASGTSSHAEGLFTKASKDYQHAQGKYNIEDSAGTYADIIGNGTSDTARSNAATVDWSGNAWYAGDVYVGSTSGTNKDAGSKKLATEEYASALGITNATVGQIAKITAVDSNGKPTAWEPVDMASGGGENALRLIVDTTTTEDVKTILLTEDMDGNPMSLKEFIFEINLSAASGTATGTIAFDGYRIIDGVETYQYGWYCGKSFQIKTSKVDYWGELSQHNEKSGLYAILKKKLCQKPYSNDSGNSDGGTYHRMALGNQSGAYTGEVHYIHETIDAIHLTSHSDTVLIPTGTKIKIWGVDA